MIKDDTRQTIEFVAWLVGIIVFIYFAFLVIFYKSSSPERNETRQMNQIALQKSPIRQIKKNYHLNRGTNSYALEGTAKDHSKYYFIYLPGSKKAYLFPATKGVSEQTVRKKFATKRPSDQIAKVNLGWYRNQAVWEVTSKNAMGDYNYQLYEFKSGKLIG